MIRKNLVKPTVLSLLLALTSHDGMADLVFEFDYSQSKEFNEGNMGSIRRAALEDAARLLGSHFSNEAVIQIEVTSLNNPESNTLASAAGNFVDPPDDFFGFWPSVVERKVKEGIDGNGPDADGVVSVNFGTDWDLDDDIGLSQFDFKATMIHELLHALGFSSGISENGEDAYQTLPGDPGVWSVFDQFLSDRSGNLLIDQEFILDGDLWLNTSLGGSSPADGLFFAGPHAVEANGGEPVGLFSPTTWSEGSSGSHLDDDNPAFAGFLMLSATVEGPYTRQLMEVERAMLADLGYSIKPTGTVPDPNGKNEFRLNVALLESGAAITLTGAPGIYQVEATADLENWEIIGTIEIGPGQTETGFEEELIGHQFYRASLQ